MCPLQVLTTIIDFKLVVSENRENELTSYGLGQNWINNVNGTKAVLRLASAQPGACSSIALQTTTPNPGDVPFLLFL